jgi:hypothetical protein
MEKIDNYNIRFEDNNPNAIRIEKDGKLVYMIACPPTETGCDLIPLDDKKNSGEYIFDFKGLVLISNVYTRRIFHEGYLIAEIKR